MFPECGANFADFGHNLRFSGFMREKFAAKFTEAGNLKLQEVSQFPTSPLRAAALTSIVFHSIFPQAAQSCRLSGVLFNFCVFQQPAKVVAMLLFSARSPALLWCWGTRLRKIAAQLGAQARYFRTLSVAQQDEFKSVIESTAVTNHCVHAERTGKFEKNYFSDTKLLRHVCPGAARAK